MAIHFQHSVDVASDPQQAFAVLDDLTATPKWLERCTGIEKLKPGPNAVGDKLKYSYKEGGRSGVMDGEITARTPSEHLSFRYWDKMMDVMVDFRVSPAASGARLVHTIEITPRTFFAKLLSPMIRKQLPKQTTTAMEKLKSLLQAGA
jgi:hypothetical protein